MFFACVPCIFPAESIGGLERAEGLQTHWNNMFQSRILLSRQHICSILPLHSGSRAICPWKLVQCRASLSPLHPWRGERLKMH